MINYENMIDLDNVTLVDCLDLYEKKGRNKHMLDDGKGKVVDDIFSLSPLS